MNGIFIIAHDPIASALRNGVLHVFPEYAAHIIALDVLPNAGLETTQKHAQNLLSDFVAQHQGYAPFTVLLVADIFGATPCNIAQGLLTEGIRSQLIVGANLPMLLRAVSYQTESLNSVVSRAITGGIQGVMIVATIPQQHQTPLSHDQDKHHHQQ